MTVNRINFQEEEKKAIWNLVYVRFKIVTDSYSAEQITKELGLEPSCATSKGEIQKPLPFPSRKTIWTLSTDPQVYSSDVNEHLFWLMEMLQGHDPFLKKLAATNAEMRVIVSQFIWSKAYSFSIPSNTSKFFSRYGIDVDFDYTYYSEHPSKVSIIRR